MTTVRFQSYSASDDDLQPPTASQWVASERASTVTLGIDSVQWQSSQVGSNPLNKLLQEANQSVHKRPCKTDPTSISYLDFPNTITTSTPASSTRARMKRSTSAGRISATPPTNPSSISGFSPSPLGSVSGSVSTTSVPSGSPTLDDAAGIFNQLVKDVSVRIHKNALAKKQFHAAHPERRIVSAPAIPSVKAKGKEKECANSTTVSARVSKKPKSAAAGPSTARVQAPVQKTRNLPADGRYSMPELPVSTTMEVDDDVGSGGITPSRNTLNVSSAPARILPSPVPPSASLKACVPPPRPPKRPPSPQKTPPRSRSRPAPVPLSLRPSSITPVPPPLPSQKPLKHAPSLPPKSTPNPTQHRSSQAVPSKPPVLGMRGNLTTSSVLTPSQVLPDKQKAFKPPLMRNPPPKPVQQQPSPAYLKDKVRPASPEEPSEADSSYGEISFDMDTLEMELSKYD